MNTRIGASTWIMACLNKCRGIVCFKTISAGAWIGYCQIFPWMMWIINFNYLAYVLLSLECYAMHTYIKRFRNELFEWFVPVFHTCGTKIFPGLNSLDKLSKLEHFIRYLLAFYVIYWFNIFQIWFELAFVVSSHSHN